MAAMERLTKPYYTSMEKQTAEREEFYWVVSLSGDLILYNVKTTDVNDANPGDVEWG